MPNQRQPGTKLAGAYIGAEKDEALAKLAALKGYANKAEFIRFLFDEAIAENEQALKKARSTGKPKRGTSLTADKHRHLRASFQAALEHL